MSAAKQCALVVPHQSHKWNLGALTTDPKEYWCPGVLEGIPLKGLPEPEMPASISVMANHTNLTPQQNLILEVLQQWNGPFCTEVGNVLSDLALLSGVPYKSVSGCVLALEAAGFVTVERHTHEDARRANKLVCITLT